MTWLHGSWSARIGVLATVIFPGALMIGSAGSASAQTILNIERLQPSEVEGWHWGTEGTMSISGGNSEYVDILAGFVLGYRWTGDWIRVFTGLDYRSETGKPLEDDGYLHIRYNHWWAGRWQTFHFVQFQSSHEKLLRSRFLIGSGLRRRLIDSATTLDVGTGGMYEREALDANKIRDSHSAKRRVWRMANLIVATRRLTETIRAVGVGYVQPEFADFADFRTLVDLSLLVRITENVDLTIRNEYRHDSRPPGGVKADDLLLRAGFALTFR